MKEPFALRPEEMARAASLMAHPAASLMALSAVGIGFAGQAFGTWVGTMSHAAELSLRFWQPLLAAGQVRAAEPILPQSREAAAPTPDARVPARKVPVAGVPARDGATVVTLRKPAKEAAPASKVSRVTAPVSKPAADAAPSAPARMEKPARADDLKAISGIGPKLEQVLNGLGIWTYAQISAWGEDDIAWVEDFLGFKGRIGRDDWIGQAMSLTEKSRTADGAGERT